MLSSFSLFYKLNRNISNISYWAFVVTSTQNHWIIHLFNIIEILNKYKIFQDHQIRKFSNNIDLRKLDFFIAEKISEHSRFVDKDVSQR